jgi:hypothetical protein
MNKKGYWLGKKAIDSDNTENASCGIFLEKGKPDIYIVQSNRNFKFELKKITSKFSKNFKISEISKKFKIF